MKVLVTGNLGYLGPLVVEKLQSNLHEVHGLDTGMYLHQLAEPLTLGQLPFKQYFVDLRNGSAGKKYDTIVHLAGLSNDPMGALDEQETKDVNYFATLRLMEHYPTARHVFASSASVYGHSDTIVRVGSPTHPLTAYAKSKLLVEQAMRADFHGAALRFGTLFGWAPNFRTDLVVNRMCYDALTLKAIHWTDVWRPLLHVDEAAKAIVAEVEGTADHTIDVVQVSVKMSYLANLIERHAPNFITTKRDQSPDNRDYRLEATVTPAPMNGLEATVQDLMKRNLPLSIRLDAYKEAR